MALVCLPKRIVDTFKKALLDGTISPEKLTKMTSEERRSLFETLVGKDYAKEVNAQFESKLLLKNQQLGMVHWAERLMGMSKEAKRDLLSKIEKLDKVLNPTEEKAFLEDLASKRLGIDITLEEAKTISNLAKNISDSKDKIPENSPIGSSERVDYGLNLALFKDYVGQLKLDNVKMSVLDYIKHPADTIASLGGTLKSMLSTLDNSFFGRQGVKMLYTHPIEWGQKFIDSWRLIGRELKGQDAMTPIKADVWSRPNALNGRYDKMKLDIGISGEEAFPSTLPERIPLLGRAFKGAETAFNGTAMRMRADYADMMLEKAEKMGKNIDNIEEIEGIGDLVNSMTGRGSIGKAGVLGKEINSTMFSIRFLKSNFDTLLEGIKGLSPIKRGEMTFARREAGLNLLKIATSIATINILAETLHPGSTENDPRASNFGKIKIGNRTFDPSGGLLSLIDTASRLVPTIHNGEWGFWSKGRTGVYTKLNSAEDGKQTALDVFNSFWEGKVAPLAGMIRDIWNGETYQGKTPTIPTELQNLTEPLSVQQFQQIMQDPDKSGVLWSMVLEGLGFNMNVQLSNTDWNQNIGVELQAFKNKIGDSEFKKANEKFNNEVTTYSNGLKNNPEFQMLSDEEKQAEITKKKADIKQSIFNQYGFKYKKAGSTKEPQSEYDKWKAKQAK
jgi:hypothetical protein